MDQIKKEYKEIQIPEGFEEVFFQQLPKRKNRRPVLLALCCMIFLLILIPRDHINIYYEEIDLTSKNAMIHIENTTMKEKRDQLYLYLDVTLTNRRMIQCNKEYFHIIDGENEIIDSNQKVKGNIRIMIDTIQMKEGQQEIIQIGSDKIEVEKVENGFIIQHIGGNDNE